MFTAASHLEPSEKLILIHHERLPDAHTYQRRYLKRCISVTRYEWWLC